MRGTTCTCEVLPPPATDFHTQVVAATPGYNSKTQFTKQIRELPRVRGTTSFCKASTCEEVDSRECVLGFRVQGSGYRVQGSGCRIQGSGFEVQDLGFRVQSSGFRLQGSGFSSQFKNNYLTEICSGSAAGSYLKLIDFRLRKLVHLVIYDSG